MAQDNSSHKLTTKIKYNLLPMPPVDARGIVMKKKNKKNPMWPKKDFLIDRNAQRTPITSKSQK